MMEIRLQKFLAEAGIASRRKSEELIRQGRVRVNGLTVKEMGVKITEDDNIEVDGQVIHREEKKVYLILNKPVGYVTTAKDQFSRPIVLDLVSDVKERVYPVGRLDYDTSGLLLLTNDGDVTYRLTHPKYEKNKVYIAELLGTPDREDVFTFKKGIQIEDYKTAPSELSVIESDLAKSKVKITIHEGKNRQVRKMCEAIGHPVITLKRIAMGDIQLGDLPEGKWRYLTEREINSLK